MEQTENAADNEIQLINPATMEKTTASKPEGMKMVEQFKKTSTPLLALDFNFSSLNDILKNIIQVLNQHAHIINTIQMDSKRKVYEKDISLQINNAASNLPPKCSSNYILDVSGKKKEVKMKPESDIKESFDNMLLKATTKLSDVIGLIGINIVGCSETMANFEARMDDMEDVLSKKVFTDKFEAVTSENKELVLNKIKTEVDKINARINELDQRVHNEIKAVDAKVDEVDISAKWKLKDLEDLLQTRISEKFLHDSFKVFEERIRKQYETFFEFGVSKFDRASKDLEAKFKKGEQFTHDAFKKLQADVSAIEKKAADHSVSVDEQIIIAKQKNEEEIKALEKIIEAQVAEKSRIAEDIEFLKDQNIYIKEQIVIFEKFDDKIFVKKAPFDEAMKNIENVKTAMQTNQEINIQHRMSLTEKMENLEEIVIDKITMEDAKALFSNIEQKIGMEIKKENITHTTKLNSELEILRRELDKKMTHFKKELDMQSFKRALNNKAEKEDIEGFMANSAMKLNAVEKFTTKFMNDIQQLESFTQNLALALKNLENSQNQSKAILRNKSIDASNCLSCGKSNSVVDGLLKPTMHQWGPRALPPSSGNTSNNTAANSALNTTHNTANHMSFTINGLSELAADDATCVVISPKYATRSPSPFAFTNAKVVSSTCLGSASRASKSQKIWSGSTPNSAPRMVGPLKRIMGNSKNALHESLLEQIPSIDTTLNNDLEQLPSLAENQNIKIPTATNYKAYGNSLRNMKGFAHSSRPGTSQQ